MRRCRCDVDIACYDCCGCHHTSFIVSLPFNRLQISIVHNIISTIDHRLQRTAHISGTKATSSYIKNLHLMGSHGILKKAPLSAQSCSILIHPGSLDHCRCCGKLRTTKTRLISAFRYHLRGCWKEFRFRYQQIHWGVPP